MKWISCLTICLLCFYSSAVYCYSKEVKERNDRLLKLIKDKHKLSDQQLSAVKTVFDNRPVISQGNPVASKYAMTKEACLAKKIEYSQPHFETICKAPFMAPLYDPSKEKPEDAKVCIDQFEFPNIPCQYPVVWTKAYDAAKICQAMGKRLCDTHEWEGACAGRLTPPDYRFDLLKGNMTMNQKHRVLRKAHNSKRKRTWSYGPKEDHSLCAAGSFKSKGCSMNSHKSEWNTCGSNFYPVGAFPKCKSTLGVYDIHGNAAEAMNLPLKESELASRGGLGVTELKGSWYIFANYKAHQDDCRWRAPFWHGATIQKSHDAHNHLGFRCCKNL